MGPFFCVDKRGDLAQCAGTPLRRRFALPADAFAGPSAFELGMAHQAATGLRRMRDLIVDVVCVAVCRLYFFRCRAQLEFLRLAVFLGLAGTELGREAAELTSEAG